MKKLVSSLLLAALLWTVMFSPWTAPKVNFWWMMSGSATLLALMASSSRPSWWEGFRFRLSDVGWGVVIAVGLWLTFWTGDKLSTWLFDFARPQVDAIYGMKEGESPWLLTALMILLIGPAEEIFWRGYVQRTLSCRWSATSAWLTTALVYALVHAGSCNFMLTMAALVAGGVWGTLYRYFPSRLGALIVSHALWDVAVFIWFPI